MCTPHRFRGHSDKFERPMKLSISAHSHIKDHVNMVKGNCFFDHVSMAFYDHLCLIFYKMWTENV